MKSYFAEILTNLGSSKLLLLGLSSVASAAIAHHVPAIAGGAGELPQQRYIEVTEVEGNVTSEGQPVQVGDRLQVVGDDLRTGEDARATLVVDRNLATVQVGENTNLTINRLTGTATVSRKQVRGGSTQTDLGMSQGRIRVRVRELVDPQSRFIIETPAGSAGVRGTEFGVVVLPGGETIVSGLNGLVDVMGQDQRRTVQGGYTATIRPGQPPTTPRLTQRRVEQVAIALLSGEDAGKVQISMEVNPVNAVFVNGEPIDPGANGRISTVVPIPANRRLRVVVRDPLGDEQVYDLIVPGSDSMESNSGN